MKFLGVLFIIAILGATAMAMQIRPKRQFTQGGESKDLENRYGWQSRPMQGSQWNQIPGQNYYSGQGQFPSQYPGFLGQGQFPGQGYIHGQNQYTGYNQFPMQAQLPGYSQYPGYGHFPGQGQFAGQAQLPFQWQFPVQGQIPGQSQFPVQGQIPGQSQFAGQAQLPVQGQFPVQGIPGQNGFPGQSQFQFPGQGQFPGPQSSTLSPNNNGISNNASQQECIRSCPVTAEHNPVCGTDLVQYSNPGRLACAQACGVSVSLLVSSPCPTTTTTSTTTTSTTVTPN